MGFLAEILERKRREVAERRSAVPDATLEDRVRPRDSRRNLFAALSSLGGPTRIVAEVKRASPSVGAIHQGLDPVALAQEYSAAGAAGVSVLTDGPGFGGSLEDLSAVRARVGIPLLRKDFLLDRYQLLEARLAGADVVLLIVAALDDAQLKALHREAGQLDLEVLVEVHDAAELERAHQVGARLIGVNNRDLKTFQVDLATSERLIPAVAAEAKAIAESGVKGTAEIARLREVGAANFLVGEALVRAPSATVLLRSLTDVGAR